MIYIVEYIYENVNGSNQIMFALMIGVIKEINYFWVGHLA